MYFAICCVAAVAKVFDPPEGKEVYDYVFDLTGEVRHDRSDMVRSFLPLVYVVICRAKVTHYYSFFKKKNPPISGPFFFLFRYPIIHTYIEPGPGWTLVKTSEFTRRMFLYVCMDDVFLVSLRRLAPSVTFISVVHIPVSPYLRVDTYTLQLP